MEEKCCSKCKEIKSILDFHKSRACKDGLKQDCKSCRKAESFKLRNNPEYKKRMKENLTRWRHENPEKRLEQDKKYRQRKKRYGLRLAEREELIRAAKGCNICGRTELLGIDHSHTTGKVRGVLCRQCNAALGLFKDSVDSLSKAMEYLITHI